MEDGHSWKELVPILGSLAKACAQESFEHRPQTKFGSHTDVAKDFSLPSLGGECLIRFLDSLASV